MPADIRSLSRAESQVILAIEERGQERVSIHEIARLLGRGGPSYARKMAHTLSRKAWLQRVGRGEYLLNPARQGPEAIPEMNPYRVGSHLANPYHFGYGTAANLHGLFTQVFRTCFIVTPVQKQIRISEPTDFQFVHVNERKFFGSTTMEKYGSWFQVSDLEKTVLDCVDRPEFAGGIPGVVQILSAAKPRLDYGRLRDYVRQLDNRSLAQRLGFLLKLVRPDIAVPRSFEALLRRLRGDSFVPLGSPLRFGRIGTFDGEWRVIVNLTDAALLGEVEVR